MLGVLVGTIQLTACFYHVMYAFQTESTLYSCLNVKEILTSKAAPNLTLKLLQLNSNYNQVVPKGLLNNLAKLPN